MHLDILGFILNIWILQTSGFHLAIHFICIFPLYQGIPEQAEVPPVAQPPTIAPAVNPPAQAPQPAQPVPSSGPNANPLDLFPQVPALNTSSTFRIF